MRKDFQEGLLRAKDERREALEDAMKAWKQKMDQERNNR